MNKKTIAIIIIAVIALAAGGYFISKSIKRKAMNKEINDTVNWLVNQNDEAGKEWRESLKKKAKENGISFEEQARKSVTWLKQSEYGLLS